MQPVKTLLTGTVLFTTAAFTMLSSPQPAQAQSYPYAVVCLVNNSGVDLNYQYKWGNQGWQADNLNSDQQVAHSWRYSTNAKTSPEFKVKFDADLTDGVNFQVYRLDRYQATAKRCEEGKVYEFGLADSESIDLYDTE